MALAAPARPILRYPGGKWLIAPWILEYFPRHRCYVEPCVGAGSVFFQKPRAYAEVLNDLNGEVISLHRILRDPAQAAELQRLLALTPFSRAEYEEAYMPAGEPLEQARRLLVRSWQSFNGEGTLGYKSGWRRCSDRRGTLPAHDWASLPEHISSFVARLQGVILEQDDALALLPRYDAPTTLWYVDPPYDETVCPNFAGYGATVDHEALARALQAMQGMVIVSGYRSPRYDNLYEGWYRIDHRAYAGTGKTGARKRIESLWLNRTCERALEQMSLFRMSH